MAIWHALETSGAVMLFAVFWVVILPLVLLSPVWITALVAWAVGRYSRLGGWLVVVVAVAAVLVWWERGQARLAEEDAAIERQIARAPRLRIVPDAPRTLMLVGGIDGQELIEQPGCMERLFVGRAGRPPIAYGSGLSPAKTREGVPTRYLQLDTDVLGRSPFGKRDSIRGPFELWVVEGRKRRLVNVFFLPRANTPSALNVVRQGGLLVEFLSRATGRCVEVKRQMAASTLYGG